MYICKYCGKEFEKQQSLAAHYSHCKLNPNKTRNTNTYKEVSAKSRETYIKNHLEKYKLLNFVCICEKCGKEYIVKTTQEKFNKGLYRKTCSVNCANGHIVNDETKIKISNSVFTHYQNAFINKIKTDNAYKIDNNGIIHKYAVCEKCGKTFELNRIKGKHKRFCDDCYPIICKENFENKINNKCFLAGKYKGIQCDSSWELAFVVYNIEHNINIKRANITLKYEYNNKKHLYFPDFDIDGQLYEIKGFENEKAKIKNQLLGDKIIYINSDKIKPYLEYVINKYGKDFASVLYDKI